MESNKNQQIGAAIKKVVIEYIKIFISLIIIYIIVTYGWRLLEIIMIGRTNPNNVDAVVGIVLTISLYGNLKAWREKTKQHD